MTGVRYSMVAKAIEDGKIECRVESDIKPKTKDELAPDTFIEAQYRAPQNAMVFPRESYGSVVYEERTIFHEATHAIFDLFAASSNTQTLAIEDETAAVLAEAHYVRLSPRPTGNFAMMIDGRGERALKLVDRMMAKTGDFERDDRTYENSIADLKRLCQSVKSVGVKPVAMLWNVASIRVTDVLQKLGFFDDPLYCEVVLFSGKTLGFGHPGTIKGMHSMLDFFPANSNWHWSAHSHDNTLGIAAGAIEAGGHATLGLGDYHYPELGLPTNGQLVAYVATMARAMGREVATVAEEDGGSGLDAAD